MNESIRRRLEDAGVGGMVHSRAISGSKETRAFGLAGAVGAGNLVLAQADWVDDVRREMDAFPGGGEHDDIIDSLSLGFAFLDENRQALGSVWVPGTEPTPRDGTNVVGGGEVGGGYVPGSETASLPDWVRRDPRGGR